MRTAFGKTYLGGNAPRPIIPNVEACANIIRSRRLLLPPPQTDAAEGPGSQSGVYPAGGRAGGRRIGAFLAYGDAKEK